MVLPFLDSDDPVRRFHAKALPLLVEAGLARLSTLTIEGQVVGAYYGLQDGRRAYAYLGGNAFGRDSKGRIKKDDQAMSNELQTTGHLGDQEYSAYVYYEFEIV